MLHYIRIGIRIIGIEMRDTLEIVKQRCLGAVQDLMNKFPGVTLTDSTSLQPALSPTRSKRNFVMASIFILPASRVAHNDGPH